MSSLHSFLLQPRSLLLVHTLCLAIQDLLQVILKFAVLHVWIQLLAREIAKILGVFRSVVSTDTPRQLILGSDLEQLALGIARILFDRSFCTFDIVPDLLL